MVQIPKFDFLPYLEIARRRWFWIALPFIICLLGGTSYLALTPKMYKAKTLILVEEQKVPNYYVKSTITESLRERLRSINQQVTSRSNLEKIIKEYDLYARQKAARKDEPIYRIKQNFKELLGMTSNKNEENNDSSSLYGLIQNIRENKINVSLKAGKQAFEISFKWNDPEIAAKVANSLASRYIEQNLQYREQRTMGTTQFLASEVERLKEKLEKKEKKLEKFKQKHMGMLPSQLQTNNNILNQLRQERNNLEERISLEKEKAMQIRQQLNNLDSRRAYLNDSNQEQNQLSKQEQKLQNLKNKMDSLKIKFTENHPDVVQLQKRIQTLQQEIYENAEKKKNDEKKTKTRGSPREAELYNKLDRTEERINKYENKMANLEAEIQKYKNRVEETPEVGMQLKDIKRDYETVQRRYQDILSKKLNAQMSAELEKKQKGEQFRVVNSAVPPNNPYKPNISKIMFFTLVMGLGLGGGAAYLRETLDPAFYTPEEIEEYLNTEVIVSLPIDKSKKK